MTAWWYIHVCNYNPIILSIIYTKKNNIILIDYSLSCSHNNQLNHNYNCTNVYEYIERHSYRENLDMCLSLFTNILQIYQTLYFTIVNCTINHINKVFFIDVIGVTIQILVDTTVTNRLCTCWSSDLPWNTGRLYRRERDGMVEIK